MKLNEIAANKPIILVFGKLCSGKGTYCGSEYPSYVKIITSDVVRKVSGETKRSGLGNTGHLDILIANELNKQIKQLIDDGKNVIVDGIRQQTIVNELITQFGKKNIEMIWLEVPVPELKKRYYGRGHSKDDQRNIH